MGPGTSRSIRSVVIAGLAVVAGVALVGCAPSTDNGATTRPSIGRLEPTTSVPTTAFRPTGPTQTATVVRVVDGDTIIVRIGGQDRRLRYIGMDTPETKKPDTPVQWMGAEASGANAALVAGRTVVLEKDVSETDRFGRLLRYVWLADGDRWTLVDLELVRRGFAQVVTDPPDVKYADRFLDAQRAARAAATGLWGPRPAATP